MLACGGPGTLYSPDGTDELRTASYRVGIRDGAPELVILLSNGVLGCGFPFESETAAQAEAVEGMVAAACREGARHVALRLYDRDARFTGSFPGLSGADGRALETLPRVSAGAYYAVEEAFLIEIDGLDRGYAASEDLYLPELGDGGRVEITSTAVNPAAGEVGAETLSGWFDFPDERVSGEFRAERCIGDTSLIDAVTAQTDHFCQ
jgi:hypothetical protein